MDVELGYANPGVLNLIIFVPKQVIFVGTTAVKLD